MPPPTFVAIAAHQCTHPNSLLPTHAVPTTALAHRVGPEFTCILPHSPVHLNCFLGHIDEHLLATLHQGYTKQDPLPRRIKPILPLPLLHKVYHVAILAGGSLSLAMADMGYIGFFYLSHPGEYLKSKRNLKTPVKD
jgi:hypothetical protein